MAVVIQKPEDVASSGLARLGIYGDNGTGKTTFLSTIPPEIPTLVLSADNENIKPLRGHDHFGIAKIQKWDDLVEIYVAFARAFAAGKPPKWKAVAFDTVTRFQMMALRKVTGQALPAPGDEAKFLQTAPKLAKGYDAWDSIGALTAELVRQWSLLPLHTIFLMQEMTRTPKYENDILETSMALTPAAVREVKTTLEIIGRLYVQGAGKDGDELSAALTGASDGGRQIDLSFREQRVLLLGKHDRYFAKGPTHQLGYAVLDPTWDKLAASWSTSHAV